jgi:lipopolysaccharide export system protein LptA
LRKSSANELKWSEQSGQVNLHGNAKVSHQKWGVAIGEHIILLEEDGRAEVIGGNKGRSKLLLPALNKTNATQ